MTTLACTSPDLSGPFYGRYELEYATRHNFAALQRTLRLQAIWRLILACVVTVGLCFAL